MIKTLLQINVLILLFPLCLSVFGQHNPGINCFDCHSNFKIAGTVFNGIDGTTVQNSTPVSITQPDGNSITLDNTDESGNIAVPVNLIPDGDYIIKIGEISSRTWHNIPNQGSCNSCHISGGNGSTVRTKKFPDYHTQIPPDNDCTHCHHFPATMSYIQLKTTGVLNTSSFSPTPPGSQVEIAGNVYSFEPVDYQINTTRSDIFALGYFSMFDVILAVAQKNNIPVEYYYDESRKTHFIKKINNISGDYWYHFSYDAGTGNRGEIQYKRANRWDETLWRSGVWIKVVKDENLEEIKKEYLEEINRENAFGHIIPSVKISINPSSYQGNPSESGRITVTRELDSVIVTAHNLRSTGYPTPYSKPFQPGVVTSLDILHSLKDQGHLNLVTGVFYTYFAKHYIDSYYVVAMGFPGIGTAHASGRQGFVYVTENGTFNRLPNNADRKFHMTSDISVIHAPDFSYWRWIELRNPYYESTDPTTGVDDRTTLDDYDTISRGFNLHPPYPNPFNEAVKISFNIFEPNQTNITIFNTSGQEVALLYNEFIKNIGIHELSWKPTYITSGVYYVVMKYGNHKQVRRLVYIK